VVIDGDDDHVGVGRGSSDQSGDDHGDHDDDYDCSRTVHFPDTSPVIWLRQSNFWIAHLKV
jgi:hypothetical protein